jgi:hypothetical protein
MEVAGCVVFVSGSSGSSRSRVALPNVIMSHHTRSKRATGNTGTDRETTAVQVLSKLRFESMKMDILNSLKKFESSCAYKTITIQH